MTDNSAAQQYGNIVLAHRSGTVSGRISCASPQYESLMSLAGSLLCLLFLMLASELRTMFTELIHVYLQSIGNLRLSSVGVSWNKSGGGKEIKIPAKGMHHTSLSKVVP
jgi:hypothetical protein